MKAMKEEMERLRALADDRERLSMTAQSLEDRLKERETQVRPPLPIRSLWSVRHGTCRCTCCSRTVAALNERSKCCAFFHTDQRWDSKLSAFRPGAGRVTPATSPSISPHLTSLLFYFFLRGQVNNLQTDKEKLESYTKKTLHKFQDKYMVAISHCKTQIAEKNEKIDYLEVSVRLSSCFFRGASGTVCRAVCYVGAERFNTHHGGTPGGAKLDEIQKSIRFQRRCEVSLLAGGAVSQG